MTAHAWYIENRAAFVARSLERGEERTFRDHLVRCDECTREVARLERELGWLPMGVAPVAPPPGFARQMAAEILDRPSRLRRRLPLAVAAGLALVSLGVSMSARHDGRELRERLRIRRRREHLVLGQALREIGREGGQAPGAGPHEGGERG